jgi:septal ring factor EnvC (AmiA/AmiB activator)
MADITKVRSAYAFFQGKRQPVGGEKVPVAPTAPVLPAAAQVQPPVAAQPKAPAMVADAFQGTAQIIAELERRIAQLETALKEAKKQQPAVAVATPPIAPVPPIKPVPPTTIPTQPNPITDEINKVDQQVAGEIDKFNQELNQGIGKVNREIARVTTQVNQVNTALQTQIPALTNQVNQTVTAFKGIIDAFKGIF